ncbi:peptide chain release factor N(5)-glutamine methyltransferase [bacterium]|nr:peptide chain release factor N(5)-glutamine methyltransferase [bacterium]
MDKVWTVGGILEWTAFYFKDLGIDRPRFETELLLAFSLGVERIWLYTHYKQPLMGPELNRFRSSVIRRSRREPLQYIIGEWGFWSLDFYVSPSVLIPRQETEHLVEIAAGMARHGSKMFDICTGCGNIAISLAKECPSSFFCAADISPEAFNLARRNAMRHKVSDRIRLFLGDLFDPVKSAGEGCFDLILCNPPYIPTNEIGCLQPEIREFEPKLALDGGEDGLSFYRRLIPDAIGFLNQNGHIIMEIGEGQAKDVKDMLISQGYQDIAVIKDYAGLDRVVRAKRP